MQVSETRRSFWGWLWAALAGLFVVRASQGATRIKIDQIRSGVAGPGLMGYGADQVGTPVTVGAGLSLATGVLSASGLTVPMRSYGVPLVRDGSGNYPLPTGVRGKTVVYRNGLRQDPTDDYSILANVVTPADASLWPADAKVLADGE